MQREWSAEELIGSWTLVDEDWRLVSNKRWDRNTAERGRDLILRT